MNARDPALENKHSKKCVKCGNELPEYASFCDECGEPQPQLKLVSVPSRINRRSFLTKTLAAAGTVAAGIYLYHIYATTQPPPGQPPTVQEGGQIQVRCSANPYSIPAGGQVGISILAFTEQGSPISGANVRIESGGGWFSRSGANTEIGQTDTGGSFTTQWLSPTTGAGVRYQMVVTVTKNGFTAGTCEFFVQVQ